MTRRDRALVNPLILLVEDNEDDAFLTTRALRREAVEVKVARDGAEALHFLFCQGRYADRDPGILPHLVLLDINLPALSGLEVLRRLRADARTRLLPVVMLSSSALESDLAASYAGGANSYLQKPVGTDVFGEMAQRLKAYWLGLNLHPATSLAPKG